MRRPALLVIDMQNDFVLDGAPLKVAGAGPITGKIRNLLEVFRRNRLPVIHVVRVHRADGSDVEIFRKELFEKAPFAVEGTKGAAVITGLKPRDGEIILRKTRMSAFMHTELDIILRTLCSDTLFVAGIQTPNCIRTTVFDACALNYHVYLVEDAVAAASEEVHRANCRDMAAIGVSMIGVDAVEAIIRR